MFSKKLLIGAVSAVLLAASGISQAADPIVFKMGFTDPENSNYVAGGKKIAAEVARLTDNRINIEVYGSSALGGERDMYEGAQIGTIDIATCVNVVLSGFIPELKVLDQPFLFDSVEQAHAVVDGEFGKLVEKKGLEQGVHIVGWLESGFRNVYSRKPITKIEDFKGVKIRTMENPVQIAAFNSLGAIASPMAYAEHFTALQQGTIDAAENAVSNVLAGRLYELTKNVTYTNHLYTFIAVILSDKAWQKIPEDLRPKVLEGIQLGVAFQRDLLLKANSEATVELKKLGVQFHEIDREAILKLVKPAVTPLFKDLDPTWVKAIEDTKKKFK
jgi:tripartite ATP-independent transporter DctP family solute receptor